MPWIHCHKMKSLADCLVMWIWSLVLLFFLTSFNSKVKGGKKGTDNTNANTFNIRAWNAKEFSGLRMCLVSIQSVFHGGQCGDIKSNTKVFRIIFTLYGFIFCNVCLSFLPVHIPTPTHTDNGATWSTQGLFAFVS